MGGQPFKVVDMVSLSDETYEGLARQVQKLVRSAEYHESYRQKGNFIIDPGTNFFKVQVEYSVIGGRGCIGPNSCLTEELLPSERKKLERVVGLDILFNCGVEEAKEYFDYKSRSNEEFLMDLGNDGLPKVAKGYGVPEEFLLTFQGISIRGLQKYFNESLKRPVQQRLARRLGVTRDFLEDLRKRKLA
jgi:hypothetical protein